MRQSRPAIDDENVLFVNALECPFAQRVWIALEEEDTVKYRREDIDLRDQATGAPWTPQALGVWDPRCHVPTTWLVATCLHPNMARRFLQR